MAQAAKLQLPIVSNEEKENDFGAKFNIPDLVQIKRDGNALTQSQIDYIVKAISDGTMEDAQLGAFLMSVFLKGMTNLEVASLTEAMKYSGTVFNWPSSWKVVDKHSTGGVGDKVSLVLAPALAACGLKVPMISGRGLGHTGGTLDKLESIPGFQVSLTESEIQTSLETVGCCIVGQTKHLVPADKRMYSVRDVTATVKSIPLIVSSIISKKACESLNSLVLDVKFGSGSVIKERFAAETLAEALVQAGSSIGINTTALITSNENPIGRTVGNSLEVQESIQCLRGQGPPDLEKLVVHLGAELLHSSGCCENEAEGQEQMKQTLKDGSALDKFRKMLENQGVSEVICQKLCGNVFDESCLPKAQFSTKLAAENTGYITKIDAMTVAEICLSLGAGRVSSKDSINFSVGFILHKVAGEEIEKGEIWSEIKHDKPVNDVLIQKAKSSLKVEENPPPNPLQNLIAKRIYSENKTTCYC